MDYMTPVSTQTSAAVAAMPGLPPSFVYFMSRPELTGAIPTCTLCFSNVADSPIVLGRSTGLHRVTLAGRRVVKRDMVVDALGGGATLARDEARSR